MVIKDKNLVAVADGGSGSVIPNTDPNAQPNPDDGTSGTGGSGGPGGGTTPTQQDQPNSYDQIVGNKQGYTPNEEGKANTGSGVEAAVGTDYSWNKQANTQAKNAYDTEVLNKKQEMLNNRQTLENNAVNYQTQADMMKYQNNQEAEKVGWTGGYVLDQNRQMEYLKSSIQAQMYGAMELQKYGYDSALSAARLAYDTNQQEYARQYYQEAVTAALSEAQLTGTYFSAEVKDMMSQRAVAEQKLQENPNDEQARKVVEQINGWFKANNISEAGVKTLEAWQQDQANELQWSNELWTRYQAALESAKTDIAENSSMFVRLDENGKEVWDGNNVTTGNWDTMAGGDIVDYVRNNPAAANQYYSYLDSTITGQVETGFNKWCQTNGYITTDEKGNTSVNSNKDYKTLLNQYIGSSGIIEQFEKKFAGLGEDEVYKMLSQWDFTIQLPDGSMATMTYSELTSEANKAALEPNGPKEYSGTNEKGESVSYKWESTNTGTTQTTGYNGSNYYQTTLTSGSLSGKKISVTTAMVTGVDSPGHSVEDNIDSDDIGIKIYQNDSGSIKNGYNTEVNDETHSIAWKAGTKEGDEISAFIKQCTGKDPQNGQVIVVGGTSYFYNQSGSGPYSKLSSGWIKIGGQCGKSTFKSALGAQWVD